MKRSVFIICVSLFISTFFINPCFAVDWKQDFEDMCGKTERAEGMSDDELSSMITECERVLKEATESDDPQKKVFLFRIKKCR